MVALFVAKELMPKLYPTLSQEPALAVEQTLERVRHSAWFATIAVLPLGIIIGWLCLNSIKTRKWPALGSYVPFTLRVRTLQRVWPVWLTLAISEGHLLLIVGLAWWHYFQVRSVWLAYGYTPAS